MEKNSGYAGKVSHQGAQVIKAPNQGSEKANGGKVVKGEDLRSGKQSK